MNGGRAVEDRLLSKCARKSKPSAGFQAPMPWQRSSATGMQRIRVGQARTQLCSCRGVVVFHTWARTSGTQLAASLSIVELGCMFCYAFGAWKDAKLIRRRTCTFTGTVHLQTAHGARIALSSVVIRGNDGSAH